MIGAMILLQGIANCPPHWSVDEQKPPGFSRMYWIKGGDVYYRDKDVKRLLMAHHLYFFPSGAPYSISHNPLKPLECLYFHLDLFPDNLRNLVEIPLWEHPILESVLESLEQSILSGDQVVVKGFVDVLMLYCREHSLLVFPAGKLSPLLEYIQMNLDRELSIELLSRKAGYNEQYFIRLFREEMGVSPHQYIIGCRMKEARKLLKSQRSVSDIARMTGFSDLKCFSRTFRKIHGISPMEYRKNPSTGP